MALVVVFLASAIGVAAHLYNRHGYRAQEEQVARELLAISSFKVNELTEYRRERMADGAAFLDNGTFSALASRALDEKGDSRAEADLRDWLSGWFPHHHYERVLLLDSRRRIRMSLPDGPMQLSAALDRHATEVLAASAVGFQDFFRDELDQRIRLAILAPVIARTTDRRRIGVVVLVIDPASHLYPLIARWPVPSNSAEALLVARDGEEILFLSELRFRKDAALSLRVPLSSTDVPAVRAALGREGVAQGNDYRAAPVIASARVVPSSPWFLVAKIDKGEAVAPAQQSALLVATLAGLLLMCLAAASALVWRQQNLRMTEQQARLDDADAAARYARSLLEASLDPLVTIGPEGRITDVNAASESATGVPREKLIGTDFCDYFTEPEKARKGWERTFADGMVRDYPLAIRHRDGRTLAVLYNAAVFRDGTGRIAGVFAAARDVTKQREMEAALRAEVAERTRASEALARTAADLARSNAELEQFAYITAHDLQEPLRMVVGYVQLLEKRLADSLDAETREFMAFAVEGSLRMKQMIQDVFDYSRVGRIAARVQAVESAEAAREALSRLSEAIEGRGAEVQIGPLPRVMAEPVQLVTVFTHLLGNAIKFCDDRTPRIQVEARRKGAMWRFEVRDNGIGIAPELRERLFHLFRRLHTRREYPGTGLGLAICKRIVEHLGGAIGIDAAPEGGSIFWFTLPEEASS